ncbi:MAG TPA: PxKF domain-containing protein [Blastocatellia bacterium]|nr:PxKF domain-containing protein [Blastocatellia bacterium]
MKYLGPRSLTRVHAALIIVLSLTFLGVFSISRSSAQQEIHPDYTPARMRSEALFGPFDYEAYLVRVNNGEFPFQGGDVPVISPFNSLTNNNAGSTGSALFTQSETALIAFGNTVVVGFNDSGSNAGGSNKFTGFARSTNGGATFTDGGTLPNHPNGDAGDPVLARNNATGRIYFATLQFSGSGIQVFRSDDNALTWMAPTQGAPGKSGFQDKEWITVDNFAGAGNGNVYVVARDFGAGNGIYFFRSTDNGDTFGPSGGTLITSGAQGAFVAVGPDHSIYVFWYAGTTIQMRKSTDQGLTFGPPVAAASGLVGGTNGDLGLTGIRQGTTTAAGFRSSEFPHAVVSPTTGTIYAVFANNPPTVDKADIFVVQSTDGGATWSAPLRVNDDTTTTDQWQPTLAITPDGSTLGVFYYSRQEDPANNLFKFYGRIASVTGPTLSFAPSFAISDVPSLPEFGRDSVVNTTYMGDYDMAAATPGAFHVVWSDNRDDLPGGAPRKDPNVYYKRIDLTLHVTTTVPAVASVVSTPPASYTVNVSEPVDPATLAASDFSVNGIAATSVSYTPGDTTLVFTFGSSPVTAEGLQTMSIAAGAFTSAAAGDPVAEFNGTFRFDTLTLAVVSTTPAVGGVLTLPSPLTYDVTFNEPIDPASLQIGDLQLSGIAGSAVTAVSALPGNMTARFTLSVPAEGALTATIPAGVVADAFGNVGTAFTGTYVVDIGTAPFPTPLLAKNPPGSLIYDPSITGIIGFANDKDSFTISLDPEQTVTAIVTGSGGLKPRVKLFKSPFNTFIGSAIAAAADQPALLQTAPTGNDVSEHAHHHCFFHHSGRGFSPEGGDHDNDHCPDFHASKTFTFTVSGADGTTGNYSVQLILNAARELEGTIAGKTNNTRATAQDISGSFIKLHSSLSSASRGAVFGGNAAAPNVPFQTFDFESGQQGFVIDNGPRPGRVAGLWHLSTGRGAQSGHSPSTSFYFGQGEGPGGGGDYNVGATAGSITSGPITLPDTPGVSLSFNYVLQTEAFAGFDVASVQVSNNGGATFTTIASNATSGQLPESAVWRNISFSLAAFSGQTVLIRFSFDTLDSIANAFEGWYVDDVQLSTPSVWSDYYSFSANPGHVVSAALKNLAGTGTNVFLEDEAGAVLATGVGGSTNYESGIRSFPITTCGTYYLRVSGTVGATYTLVVPRNAAFDTEANDTIATAQSLNLTRGALGHVIGGLDNASLQNFDDGLLTGYTFLSVNNASVTAAAAHDGPFGLQLGSVTEWMFRNDPAVAVQQGDTISAWVQAAGAPGGGRLYVGFGASDTGTLSMVLGGNSGSLVLQRNAGYGFQTLAEVPQTWTPNKWYRFEIVWGVGGAITGKLYDSDGTTLLNTVTGNDTTITSGGLAFRGFGPTYFVDSVQKGIPSNEDWYSVTVLGGLLKFETSTPADGPGEFVNTLDPHIELYDSTGATLLATGAPLEDGRNESINFSGLSAPVTYLIRVTGEGGTAGEYFLGAGVPAFSGFFPPLDRDRYEAGYTIPVKFSFGCDLGLDILATGSPASRRINCPAGSCAPTVGIGPFEPTESVGGGLRLTDGRYHYNWKTKKEWAGSCRELELIFKDGRRFTTVVRFK